RKSYVLTTGTGSGKSLSYITPIVDRVLQEGSGKGIRAIVVYPMNALASSQFGELQKFLCHGYPDRKPPVTFKKYTGQEPDVSLCLRNGLFWQPFRTPISPIHFLSKRQPSWICELIGLLDDDGQPLLKA